MWLRIELKVISTLFTLLILNASLGSFLRAQNLDDRPLSPRLVKLRDQLKAGDRKALDSFWKEITERGAPLIEPAAGSDRDMLVTML